MPTSEAGWRDAMEPGGWKWACEEGMWKGKCDKSPYVIETHEGYGKTRLVGGELLNISATARSAGARCSIWTQFAFNQSVEPFNVTLQTDLSPKAICGREDFTGRAIYGLAILFERNAEEKKASW